MNERPADRLAIAVAQLNPIVGDVAGNLECARKARAQAARDRVDDQALRGPSSDVLLAPLLGVNRNGVKKLVYPASDAWPVCHPWTLA